MSGCRPSTQTQARSSVELHGSHVTVGREDLDRGIAERLRRGADARAASDLLGQSVVIDDLPPLLLRLKRRPRDEDAVMGEVDEMDERLERGFRRGSWARHARSCQPCQQVVMASVWQPAWTRQPRSSKPLQRTPACGYRRSTAVTSGACHGRLQVRRDRARGGNPRRPAVPVDLDLGVEVTQSIQHFGAAHHLTDPAHQGSNNSVRLVAGKPSWVRVYARAAQNVG